MPDIPDNNLTTARITGTGTYHSELESKGDADWWQVTLTAGLTYGFKGVLDSGETGVALDIRDAQGQVIANNGGSLSVRDNMGMIFTPTQSGTYFINVRDWLTGSQGPRGAYTLTASMDDTQDQRLSHAAPLPRTGLSGALEVIGDADTYRIRLTEGLTASFSLILKDVALSLLTRVEILDSHGQILKSGIASDFGASFTPETSGLYYLRVRDTSDYDYPLSPEIPPMKPVGRFDLIPRVGDTIRNDAKTTSTILDGGAVVSRIDSYGDADWHAVQVKAGVTYTFRMNGTAGEKGLPQSLLTLRDANGEAIRRDDGWGISPTNVATITRRATQDGTVFLDAQALQNVTNLQLLLGTADRGQYRISVASDATELDGTAAADVLMGSNKANVMRGFAGNDHLLGRGGHDLIYGNQGNDTLDGGAGNDTLVGGLGDDLLIGGAGVDTADYSGSVAVTVDLSHSGPQNTGHGRDTLREIDNLIGGTKADRLTGNAGANHLFGGAGNDTLSGGAGNDTLDGGVGADLMIGGTGNDTYHVDNIGDRVVEQANGGIDTVLSHIGYALPDHVENLVLLGTRHIFATGNDLANRLTGNAGNNLLDGGGGADTMAGGAGNDTYIVDHIGDRVIERAGEGIDLVRSSVSFRLGAHVENLQLTGSGAINGSGNALDNRIIGNAAANILIGGAGNDSLFGGAGNDVLIGGEGKDILTGGAGADRFVFAAPEHSGAGNQRDEITDFSRAQGDRIDLRQMSQYVEDWNHGRLSFIGEAAFSGEAAEIGYRRAGNNVIITGDTDADGRVDFSLLLRGVTTLSAQDFLF